MTWPHAWPLLSARVSCVAKNLRGSPASPGVTCHFPPLSLTILQRNVKWLQELCLGEKKSMALGKPNQGNSLNIPTMWHLNKEEVPKFHFSILWGKLRTHFKKKPPTNQRSKSRITPSLLHNSFQTFIMSDGKTTLLSCHSISSIKVLLEDFTLPVLKNLCTSTLRQERLRPIWTCTT